MPTRADRKCVSARCFNSRPLPLAQLHVVRTMHWIPAMQHVLENQGPDVEAHAYHHRFIGPKNTTEFSVVAVKAYIERQHRCLSLPSPKAPERPPQCRSERENKNGRCKCQNTSEPNGRASLF